MLSASTNWHKEQYYHYFSSTLEAPFPIMSLSSLLDINCLGIFYYFFLLLYLIFFQNVSIYLAVSGLIVPLGILCCGERTLQLCTGSRTHGLNSSAASGILIPRPGLEPSSTTLQGRFLITGPPGKSLLLYLKFFTIYIYPSLLSNQRYSPMHLLNILRFFLSLLIP